MAMATTGEATLDNERFSAEDQRLYLREPIAFYRGARDCEESTQPNADAGVAFHGLTRESEAAYLAGWAHRALRRSRGTGTLGPIGMMEYGTRAAALHDARALEREDSRPRYVVALLYSDRAGDWGITDRAPLCGEWYTSDGIRHG